MGSRLSSDDEVSHTADQQRFGERLEQIGQRLRRKHACHTPAKGSSLEKLGAIVFGENSKPPSSIGADQRGHGHHGEQGRDGSQRLQAQSLRLHQHAARCRTPLSARMQGRGAR